MSLNRYSELFVVRHGAGLRAECCDLCGINGTPLAKRSLRALLQTFAFVRLTTEQFFALQDHDYD